ncbi:MAG: sugar phosphate nucleotidyltransferase [Thermomicrobiales bacterium]
MQIVLPVAGFGTRLRPQTWSRPKPLVTVAGKTLIDHVLDRLSVLDPDRVVFITGYLGDQIEEHVRKTYDFESVFVEQEEMLGQSHAVLQARESISGPILVLFPDMIFEADLTDAQTTDADGILWVREVEDPSRFGVVVKDGERVTNLVEKPDEPVSNLAVMGIYYFKSAEAIVDAIERQIADENLTKGEFFLADAIQMMIDDGASFTTSEATVWQDAGTNDALLDTNRYLLDRATSAKSGDGYVVIPPSLIDPTAEIRNSVIGPFASIGPGATVSRSIVGDSIIDAGASVENANISRSIIGRDAIVSGKQASLNIGDTSIVDLGSRGENG